MVQLQNHTVTQYVRTVEGQVSGRLVLRLFFLRTLGKCRCCWAFLSIAVSLAVQENLECLHTAKTPQACGLYFFNWFWFDLSYHPGEKNLKADRQEWGGPTIPHQSLFYTSGFSWQPPGWMLRVKLNSLSLSSSHHFQCYPEYLYVLRELNSRVLT